MTIDLFGNKEPIQIWLRMRQKSVIFFDESSPMKRTALILGIALTLTGSTSNVRAHGGGCYGFWPFWPLVVGAGIAVASAAASAHSSPTYVYVPPAYPYGYAQPHYSTPPSAQTPPTAAAPAVESIETASRWVPSAPGVGHWVPDPEPYNYAPGTQTKVIASTAQPVKQTVTVNRSRSDVPIYVVTR